MDVDLEVSVLAAAGRGDMGGGLIWRAQDERNYNLTRANPLEQNIRLYRVVKGVRQQLAISSRSYRQAGGMHFVWSCAGTTFK
jgi:hypothetical protein